MAGSPTLDRKALLYMSLLAVQFGIQPILTRQYTPQDITRSTVIIMQETVKFVIAIGMLYLSGNLEASFKHWTVSSWIAVACVPAALYAVQNFCSLVAYQNLDALTYNVLNQTKTLSAALCCYIVMGRSQSKMQIIALMLLLLSALIIQGVVQVDYLQKLWKNDKSIEGDISSDPRYYTYGILPILVASFISGLAGALSQKNLQAAQGRNAYFFSAEMCVASVMLFLLSMTVSPDGSRILKLGFWHGWTLETWLPIFTNSTGGILVGLVTKYAGSVRKGFALIFGIFLSGLVQGIFQPEAKVTVEQMVGGVLAAMSLYLHATHPPQSGTVKGKVD